ncbi:MAG: FG-GAP repeat protein [Candidatus Omnitrophica bacterium]|nr:FG-GAP repeat protein [Candidatus Omnitrophota bacterium]
MSNRIHGRLGRRLVMALVLGTALSQIVPSVAAGADISIQYIRTILNPDPTSAALMGSRPRFLSENEVLLGARGDSYSGTNSGRAFLFNALTGQFISSFENPDPDSGDSFGHTGVAVGSNLVAIGAFGNDTPLTDCGAVYIFDKKTGLVVQTLLSPNPTKSGHFGITLESVGDRLLVGASGDMVDGIAAGAVYLVNPLSGALVQTFHPPHPASGDRFGISLSSNGDTVLVGNDYKDDGALPDSGIAQSFDIETGNLLETFENPTPGNTDRFGSSVSISGSFAIIGAPKDDAGGENTGAVHVFDLATGTFERSLQSPDPEAFEDFGNVSDVGGVAIIVGAPSSSYEGRNLEGRAYLFDPHTGEHLGTFTNPAAEDDDYFGSGSDFSGDLCVIGSFGDDRGSYNAGSALVFRIANLPPSPTPTPTPPIEGTGLVAGFVTNASDFQIITNAILALGDNIEFPDEEGIFIFEGAKVGLQILDAVSPGYESYSKEVQIGAATLLLVEMAPRGTNPNADINFDGIVNQNDHLEIQKNWHRQFPSHKTSSGRQLPPIERDKLLEKLRIRLEKRSH